MTDARDVFRLLCDNRLCPDGIPDRPAPGVYAIFAKTPDCLAGIVLPQTGSYTLDCPVILPSATTSKPTTAASVLQGEASVRYSSRNCA